MSELLQRLSGGDRRSVGAAYEIAVEVAANLDLLDQVMDGLRGDDVILRSRCAHVLAQVSLEHTDAPARFTAEIIDHLAKIGQWEVREQLSKVIPRLSLNPVQIDAAFAIFETYLKDRSSIVRTCAMQGLRDLLKLRASEEPRIRALIEELTVSGSAAMRARGRKLLAAWPTPLAEPRS